MKNPMNLINLKMTIAVASVLVLGASIAPNAAYAQRAYSGSSIQESTANIEFELDPSAMSSTGDYPAGIQNFQVEFSYPDNYTIPDNVDGVTSLALHTCVTSPFSGATPCGNNINNVPPKSTVYYTDPFFSKYTGTTTNFNGAHTTNSSFSSTLEQQLFFYIPSISTETITSLSDPNLNDPSGILGQYTADDINLVEPTNLTNSPPGHFFQGYSFAPYEDSTPFIPSPVSPVPEPTNTVGFLFFGALGAISLLHFTGHSSKHF